MTVIARSGTATYTLEDRAGTNVVRKRWHPELARTISPRMRALAAIRHPNLVAILEVDEASYVMEYVAGDVLEVRLGARLREDEIVRIGASVARGLATLHAAGVTHGGVYPAHIFVDDCVKLGALDSCTSPPAYMAPETWDLMQSEWPPALPVAADVYALGCVLFECASGDVPFDGESVMQLGQQHIHARPPLLGGAIGDLCDAMLAKRPDARPSLLEIEMRLLRHLRR